MTTQYTPILKLALPVTGELSGTWGDIVNDNITSMIEQAIAGLATISTWTANSHTLTTANGTTSQSRCAMLVAQNGAGLSAAGEIVCPATSKLYVLKNSTSYAITLKTSGGTGVSVPSGQTAFLFCDGTNVNACVTTIVDGNISGNLTVSGNATIDGNTTLGNALGDIVTINGTATFVNAAPTLSTLTASQAVFTNGSKQLVSNAITGTGNVVMSTSPTLTTPTLGVATATSVNKVTITAPATSATLTIADGKTLTASNSLTLAGTDATTMTFPAANTTVAGLGTTQTFTGVNTLTPAARTSGAASYFTLTTPADTGQTAGTESIGANFTAGTRTWAAGALTTQRERVFAAPTYAFAGASTLTTAVNVDIAAPVAGTNATITNAYALRAAASQFTAAVNLNALTASTALALDASKNVVSVTNTGSGNNVLATSPTLTGTVGAASLTLSSLTSGRVTYAGASGLLQDSANLTFNGTDLTVSGAVNAGSVNAATLDLTNLEVTNIKAKDGTASASIADTTGAFSVSAAFAANGDSTLGDAVGDTVTVNGTTTFANAAPTLSTLTASQAVFTNGSKQLVSNAITGTGDVVMSTSPTMVTPTIGAATATSINKVAITAPATSATLTIADGKTLTANNSLTLVGTDATTMTFPAGSTTVAGLGTTQTFTGVNTLTPAARTSGVASYFTLTTPADTGQTAGTESIGANFTAATRTWATGALATQRERVFAAPTYAFAGASTLTTAVNVDIAAPVAGTNATITNAYALRAAASQFTGAINATALTASQAIFTDANKNLVSNAITGSGNVVMSTSPTLTTPTLGVATATSINKLTITAPATSATLTVANGKTLTANNSLTLAGTDATTMTFPAANTTVAGLGITQTFTGVNTLTPTARTSGVASYFTLTTPADTGQTASTESIGANFTAGTRTWAAGALTTQRERVFAAPTYAFAGASTLTTAVNVDIAAPVAGTNATITNAYALRAAASQFTGSVNLNNLTASTALALDASKNVVSVTNTGSGNNVLATSPTLSGTALFDIAKPTSLQETRVAMAANDINISLGNYFSKTISGATTLTVSNVPTTGTAASFIFDVTNGGSATITWWSGTKWANGIAPTLTVSGRDVLGFFTYDGGATWTGLVLGKDVK